MYSILDGLPSPKEYLQWCLFNKVPSMAITDHGNCNGWGSFYQQATRAGVKPIFGCEFYFVPNIEKWHIKNEQVQLIEDKLLKKEQIATLRERHHLIVLVKNEIGFKNLNRLLYESQLDRNFYYKPRIDLKMLEKYKEGLIVSSACIAGMPQSLFLQGRPEDAEKVILKFKEIWGEDYYLEVQFIDIYNGPVNIQEKSNNFLIEMGKKHNIKVIMTSDSHYIDREDAESHQTLLLLQTKSTREKLRNGDAWSFGSKNVFLHNAINFIDAARSFNPDVTQKQLEEFTENTYEIDSKIKHLKFDLSLKIKDVIPDIHNKDRHLRELCEAALVEKQLPKEYSERLDYELDIIKQKHFAPYFHLVKKTVDDARKSMMVGCARGSSGGSLVNYLLGVTEIDPLKYGLLFERFLSVNRNDPPDIDIDFLDNDRVKQDLLKEYSKDAACISAYSCFQYAGLLRDLVRCYGIQVDQSMTKINTIIEDELIQNTGSARADTGDKENFQEQNFDAQNYADLIEYSPTFKKFVQVDFKQIDTDVQKLLGKVRHIGRHAAGVVICDGILESQPIILQDGVPQTSLTEGVREKLLGEFGYVKIDILGLNTLRIIQDCLVMIDPDGDWKKVYQELLHPDVINTEDPEVYEHVFRKGNLIGIFQFNTDGIRGMIDQVIPSCLDDLSAINALYRPGPLESGFAREFGKRKRKELPSYYYGSELVKQVLEETFGILVYQETVMKVAEQVAGYTKAESNDLRKNLMKVKKTDPNVNEKRAELSEKFLAGAVKNGMALPQAKELFHDMATHAGYSFNKSHSVAYAMIGYQCAWLKTHYPLQFYCSLLRNETDENYAGVIAEIQKNGFKINYLSLEHICQNFSIFDGEIYYGFGNIYGVGPKASEELRRTFLEHPYQGALEFLARKDVNWRVVNKKVVSTLINIGVFDHDFQNECRQKLYNTYMSFFEWKNRSTKAAKVEIETTPWIDRITREFDAADGCKMTEEELLKYELEGYKASLKYSAFLIKNRAELIDRALNASQVTDRLDDVTVPNVIVQFKDIYIHIDRNKKPMAFLKMVDRYGKVMSGTIFASNYEHDKVLNDKIYVVRGKRQEKGMLIHWYRNIDDMLSEG
jgi:DNA polymerase-3 subunit alpha